MNVDRDIRDDGRRDRLDGSRKGPLRSLGVETTLNGDENSNRWMLRAGVSPLCALLGPGPASHAGWCMLLAEVLGRVH